jgi:hypothetical protein
MGLFNFFSNRRERESAIPQADADSITGKLQANDAPVGKPIDGVGTAQPFGQLGAGQTMDMGSMIGMFGMIKQAYQSGNIQISHGESQVIDMRGTAEGQELREQIMAAMQQAGIDPELMPEAGQPVDATQYAGLQQNIMDVLAQHGVDPYAGSSFEVLPDLDGDGKPG